MPYLRMAVSLALLTVLAPSLDAGADQSGVTPTSRELVDVPMVDSQSGREMLGYLAACALPKSAGAHAEKDGRRFDFPGAMGLAPNWLDDPMTTSEQRWVSACILALKDGNDGGVSVSLRAANSDNPALRPGEEELSAYTLH